MKVKFLCATFLALATVDPAQAQSITGAIEGSVTDASGAVIPGASVTATHLGTNTVYEASTNETGRFALPNVRELFESAGLEVSEVDL